MIRRVLIAGCGDLGTRLGARLVARGVATYGLRRRSWRSSNGIIPLAADLRRSETLSDLPVTDAVVFCPTPGERSESAYRAVFVEGLRNLMAATEASLWLFVSSTAVYGQDDGQQLDEGAETCPKAFNGRILLEGEAIAATRPGCIVRLGGLYGPGRTQLLDRIRTGNARCQCHPVRWTNRIHIEDAAALIDHLLGRPPPPRVVNGVDPTPTPECELMDWLSARMGASSVQRIQGRGAGKRVILSAIEPGQFSFRYPDFRQGYASLTSA